MGARYLGLLLDGARHFGLAPDYVETRLAPQPTNPTSFGLRLVSLVVLACIVLPLFVPFYVALRMGLSMRIVHVLANLAKQAIWRLHRITPVLSFTALVGIVVAYALIAHLIYWLVAFLAAQW